MKWYGWLAVAIITLLLIIMFYSPLGISGLDDLIMSLKEQLNNLGASFNPTYEELIAKLKQLPESIRLLISNLLDIDL